MDLSVDGHPVGYRAIAQRTCDCGVVSNWVSVPKVLAGLGCCLGIAIYFIANSGVGILCGLCRHLANFICFSTVGRKNICVLSDARYAHSAQAYGAYPCSLRERLSQFSDRVEQAINDENWDEILVVGHSSGAHLGTTVLSDVIARAQLEQKTVSLSFLTLGQVFPMVSFLPNADELRRDMVRVGNCASITWVDVSAPGDGCSFALCDPLAVTGLATPEQKGPLILSAAFSQTLKPQTWAQLRWRFFRLHFQYLCAFDNARDYDYFQITAGPLTLAQRYDDRAASQSRIVMPIARHRGMAQ